MRVIGVTIENYGAFHGKHEFQYADRGLTMVLGENLDEPRMNSNGAAKSTLFEVLDWCWYGKVPREDHADSIINDEAKTCQVTTHLEDDDGTPAAIKRSRPNALQFWKGGKELTLLDSKETQKLIEEFLGMDRDVFKATVFFGQNDLLHFADVGDAKRIEILSKIIPELSAVDEYLEKAKIRRDRDDAVRADARTKLLSLEAQLRGVEEIDFTAQQEQWEERRRADLESLAKRMQELGDYIKEHQADAAQMLTVEAEVARLTATPAIPRPDHGTALWEAEQRVMQLHSERGIASAEVTRLRGAIQKITQTATGVCSQCGQQVTKEHLEREAAALQVQMNEATRRADAAQQAWVDAQAPVAELKTQQAQADEAWRQAEQARTASINEMNQKLVGLHQLHTYLENARNELADCGIKVQNIERAENPLLAEMRKLEEKKAQLTQACSHARLAVAEAEEALAYAEYWVKAFGPKGLKNYILDSKLQEMTDAANYWVKVLTGGTFWVRFETQKKGRSTKKLSNELNIRVFRYNPDGRISERNYKSWSGGEKKRVSLAIDFGLSRLVARRAKKRYDLLVLDELFKHVDSAGGEAIAEMLEELKKEKSSIFVIEHDGDFQSRFENRVLLRRKNARSTIVELTNEQEHPSSGPTPSRDNRQADKAKPKRKARKRRVPTRTPIR